MAARAQEVLQYATIRPFTVASGQAATAGFAVKHSGADDAVQNMAAVSDNCIGISLDTGAALASVRVAMFGNGIAKCKVGTGGATRGAPAKYAANGLTDATVGGATTKLVVLGQFTQTGVVGDMVGINLGGFSFTVGS
jgi:hypothetical protein